MIGSKLDCKLGSKDGSMLNIWIHREKLRRKLRRKYWIVLI